MTKFQFTSAQETVRAAQISRRLLLKSAVAFGAAGLAAPLLSRNALSSSGELNLLMWSDEYPGEVIPNFEKKTGIKVNTTPFSQNEEQVNKLMATGGEGFDLCSPTLNRSPQYKEIGLLGPLDMNRLTGAGRILPAMLASARELWEWEGGLHYLPHVWGSEAISYRTDQWKGDPRELSFGSLWSDDVKGHIQGRGHSFLLGIGLWWDASGKMPTNRMLDGYKDEEAFKKIWNPILAFAIEHKAWVRQFWDTADNTKSGLMENEVWIGQTWDGPPLSLKKEGKPVNFQAPKEGAITWVDGIALTKAASNVDQAYEFLNYMHTPEVAAAVAEGSGYNPIIAGAEDLLSAVAKKNFQEAYPGDALKNLWPWPVEPNWYTEIRSQYVDQFKAA